MIDIPSLFRVFCRMELNGLAREIVGTDALINAAGTYLVDATYAGPVERLKVTSLYAVLEGRHGLRPSRVVHNDEEWGFNDHRVMGVAAGIATRMGSSHLWLSLNGETVWLQVSSEIVRNLDGETPREYAQKILDSVVTFVETPQNYRK